MKTRLLVLKQLVGGMDMYYQRAGKLANTGEQGRDLASVYCQVNPADSPRCPTEIAFLFDFVLVWLLI